MYMSVQSLVLWQAYYCRYHPVIDTARETMKHPQLEGTCRALCVCFFTLDACLPLIFGFHSPFYFDNFELEAERGTAVVLQLYLAFTTTVWLWAHSPHPTCLNNSDHFFMMSLSMSHGIAYDTTFCIRLDTHIPHTHSRHRPQCCARESSLARGFTSIRECAWCWKLHKYRTGLSHKFEDFLGDIKHHIRKIIKWWSYVLRYVRARIWMHESISFSDWSWIGRFTVHSLALNKPMNAPTHAWINPSTLSFQSIISIVCPSQSQSLQVTVLRLGEIAPQDVQVRVHGCIVHRARTHDRICVSFTAIHAHLSKHSASCSMYVYIARQCLCVCISMYMPTCMWMSTHTTAPTKPWFPTRDLRVQAVYQADGSTVGVTFANGTKQTVLAQPDPLTPILVRDITLVRTTRPSASHVDPHAYVHANAQPQSSGRWLSCKSQSLGPAL